MANIVFVGVSLDGYIADRDDGLEWLHAIPNPEQLDFGWGAFMERIDAIIMGRVTFETVCSFDIDWPYRMPVFVLSKSLTSLPAEFDGKVTLVNGPLTDVLARVHADGHEDIYIDGGATVQSFLAEDLIDEMILTTIPILLGGGTRLFGELPTHQPFDLVHTETHLNQIVTTHYKRKRS